MCRFVGVDINDRIVRRRAWPRIDDDERGGLSLAFYRFRSATRLPEERSETEARIHVALNITGLSAAAEVSNDSETSWRSSGVNSRRRQHHDDVLKLSRRNASGSSPANGCLRCSGW